MPLAFGLLEWSIYRLVFRLPWYLNPEQCRLKFQESFRLLQRSLATFFDTSACFWDIRWMENSKNTNLWHSDNSSGTTSLSVPCCLCPWFTGRVYLLGNILLLHTSPMSMQKRNRSAGISKSMCPTVFAVQIMITEFPGVQRENLEGTINVQIFWFIRHAQLTHLLYTCTTA